ncbi:ATP-binding protein [Pseudomonas syringae]|nr:ATP-binding protein [Pseudomonas syringae]
MLDEPDAFLHPQMVEKMYDVLFILVREYNVHIVMTTHSPTTVALARGEIYKLEGGSVVLQDKDSAIAELLDGVTQLSIDPENQRQVFVENRSDAIVYQWLFSSVVRHTGIVDPKVSLSFIPAGPKTPDDYLKVCVKIFTSAKDDEIREFVNLVNGMGDCGQVEVYVKALTSAKKNKTVRGIVDWDTDNRKRADRVIVAAQNYAYSLENILLDPLCVLQMVRLRNHEKYSFFEICGEESNIDEWLSSSRLAQISVNRFLLKVLGRPNAQDAEIRYLMVVQLKLILNIC